MNNRQVHNRTVDRVRVELHKRGCETAFIHQLGGVELLIHTPDGRRLTAAVRGGSRMMRRHRVTVGKKTYSYLYPVVGWSLHQHNVRKAQPDVWFLCHRGAYYIFPAAVVGPTRKTISFIQTKRGWSELRDYAGRWDVVLERQRAQRRAA